MEHVECALAFAYRKLDRSPVLVSLTATDTRSSLRSHSRRTLIPSPAGVVRRI
jgi:hypothetical protein